MINSIGMVQLVPDSLNIFNSPNISIQGHSSSADNGSVVNIELRILSQDLGQSSSSSISIPTKNVGDLMKANSISGESFVANLYPLLEQMLIGYLQAINPDSTFEIAEK